jgi:hypothetical protein
MDLERGFPAHEPCQQARIVMGQHIFEFRRKPGTPFVSGNSNDTVTRARQV